METSGEGDIAIVGMSFKLPQDVDDDVSLWKVLEGRQNLSTSWPKTRINSEAFFNDKHHKFRSAGGHFLNADLSSFDAPFFSLTAKEAAAMDPMQRWTLETSYHAFEKAGIPVESLRGSQTAVFSSSMIEDFARMVGMDPENAERTAVTGCSVSCVIPNRISWYFDLRGPSMHVNSACSSSMSALDMACKSLWSGDATCALVTGTNLILDPGLTQYLSTQNYLSPDGVCYSFDHRANGYARGEGVMALILKPISAALRDGDMIRAVIRSIGSNQDGHTPGLTQPSQQAQEALIRHVYNRVNLPLDKTRYVEAHGTGTKIGDPIEMKAVGAVFREHRTVEDPLYVGSVKTNVGHLEGACGLAAMIKAILVVEKGVIAPNALFEKINPAIDTNYYHTAVPTKAILWPTSGLRRVSVNSFGFGGSNTHVILDDAFHYLQSRGLTGNHSTPEIPSLELNAISNGISHTNGSTNGVARTNGATHTNGESHANGLTNGNGVAHTNGTAGTVNGSGTNLPKLLVWSAYDEKAVKRTMKGYESFYADKIWNDPAKLNQLAFTLGARRSHMLWRAFAVVGNDGSGAEAVKALPSAKPIRSSTEVRLVFVFTGQGAQYVNMGWDLIEYPVYKETLQRIDEIYSSLGSTWSLFDELRRSENIDKPEYSQPLSTAIQIALIELFRSFGITPKAVVGHSSGEIAAAYAVGALSLVSACKVSYFRGQLAGKLRAAKASTPGSMISINLAENKVASYLTGITDEAFDGSVTVACVNSPLNCTLSGSEAAIDVVKAQADKDGIFAQKLKTGVAYHSASMLEISEEYLSLMGELDGADPQDLKATTPIFIVSTVSGKPARPAELVRGQYWVDNMVSPVRFADALQIIAKESSALKTGLDIVADLVEIGPHPALRRPVQDTISRASSKIKIRYASALHRSQPPIQTTLELAGQLFCLGHNVSVSAVNQRRTDGSPSFLINCPEYPFDHSQKHWAEPRISHDFRLRGTVKGETLGARVSDWNPLEPRWRNFLCTETTPWLADYVMVFPAGGILVMAIEAVLQMASADRTVAGFLIEKADFINPIVVEDAWDDRIETELHLRPVKNPEDKEDPTKFDIVIYTYREKWTECLRATVHLEYQESYYADGGEEKKLADEGVRSRYQQATEACGQLVDPQAFYRSAAEHGLQYGDWFQLIQDVHYDGKSNAIARVDVTKAKYQTTSLVHPAILETAFQVLRISAGQQPAANASVHVRNAWFAFPGWQKPETNSIRWLASSKSSAASGAGFGERGSLYALADDGTVLCTIGEAVTATASKGVQEKEKKLLHDIEWKPQLSLLGPKQLEEVCQANAYVQDETIILEKHLKIRYALDLVCVRMLKQIDHSKVPESLRRHAEWIEYHVSNLPPERKEEGEAMSDADLEAQLREVDEILPAWRLYTECARRLPEMLSGEVGPLQVVFGADLADIFYAALFQSVCADGRFARFLELTAHENPAQRILELGAGTGGVTGHAISILQEREKRTGAPSFAEYVYTDISPMFFEQAKSRWPELQAEGRMNFKTLDQDKPIESQGYEPGSYDVIVAGCVLHATPNLEPTIRNVRKLLKPGGRLILLEVISPEDITINFMAGLLPGWWVSREEWRPHSACVSEDIWERVLSENGFSGNDMIIRDYKNDGCHIASIIISTAKEDPAQIDESKPKRSNFLLVVDESPEQQEQQRQLADLVLGQLDLKGERKDVSIVSLDHLSEALMEVTKDDVVVCLAEVNNKPLLTALSEDGLKCFQRLAMQATKLLWATATTTSNAQYPDYSIVQGFFRSIRAEQGSQIVTVAIEDALDNESCASFIAQAFQSAFRLPASKELEYVVRDGVLVTGRAVENVAGNGTLRSLLSPQLQQKTWGEGSALQLSVGSGDTPLFVRDDTYDTDIASHDVEVETRAWGLKFRDAPSGQSELPEADYAGIVTRVGQECDRSIQPGDRVSIAALDGIRKYARAHEKSILKIPESLSFEAAVTTLIPSLTVYHALVDIGKLQAGDKVLIHSAAGNLGQLAVQIAKAQGADILVTTSSPEETQFLVSNFDIPESRIFTNQNTSYSKSVLRITQGRGVDVVFNTLLGNDKLQASCESVATYGRFLEIGRANIDANVALPMAIFARNVTFSAVDLTRLEPSATTELLEKIVQLLSEGKIQDPQPLHNFSVSETEQAFKQLQTSKNFGRVIVTPKAEDVVPQFIQDRRSWTFDENASYLIAGGSNGLGTTIMKWMVDRGAKNLIIPSEFGSTSKATAEAVAELTARGINVVAPRCDVSSETSLANALEEYASSMPPIKGCINAAMTLQNSIFQNMTLAQWDLTIRSKVQTSWNLHRLLPKDLDFFILLSSLAGVTGQLASSNYAAGCSFQDALAHYRITQGQKAHSIDIGTMVETGASQPRREFTNNMQIVDDAELLALLTLSCDPTDPLPTPSGNQGQVLFGLRTPVDSLLQEETPPPLLNRPLFAAFSYIPGAGAAAKDGNREATQADKGAGVLFREATDPVERKVIVLNALAARLARAMSIPPGDVEPTKPLSNYGVDSLMAVDLKNWIQKEFEASIPTAGIQGGVPIVGIAELVVARSAVGKA
ncbi:uncharacterized protein F4822DRAFT_443215 [Hypoxylon trugodes]|uniref:uncharacterized protein n=1 Tax=Hypoxylon trugodes TaxID=326681 RepID=UPI002195A21E|nr:uncharacterized protein F4822DRAFT_443215 [Hypoxylon trugodes]KAI1390359.1 hypothetical protein F4822DRAFT_443215 [Hypoxylon trugodes]